MARRRKKEPLCVLFTMDCLPAEGRREVAGPPSWAEAERAVRVFAEAVAAEGMVATLFATPEFLRRLGRVARRLAEAGCEVGLLCHPQLAHYQSFLGSYGYDRQREIVRLAKAVWSEAMGREPETFRPGFFSANDYTYQVLCVEGFRQGSCSLPGRVDNDQFSVWTGTYPFPHHTDPLDRTAQGTMDFFEVPVSSDFEAGRRLALETYTPPHLRIEEPDVHQYAEGLVRRHLERMLADKAVVRSITFLTSNVAGWGAPENPLVERLRNLCRMLREVADSQHLELRGATVEGLHEVADREFERRRQERKGAD